VRDESWLTLGADQYLADGSTPLQAILELRAQRSGASVPLADGFGDGRVAAYARVDGRAFEGAAETSRRGPGVWTATVKLPAGLGGSTLTVGATFDGAPIVAEKTVPIATDAWSAAYPTTLAGGCALAEARAPGERGVGAFFLCLAGVVLSKRRSGRTARNLP
jgi:hypothetical protein